MTTIKAIVVDDERLARSELRTLLKPFSFVEICGEAANASDAVKAVRDTQPDLVFLDVEMPGKNGFEFLASLPSFRFDVIFTTAFESFAVRGFEVNAIDYLLKPINPKRLAEALGRVQSRSVAAPQKPGEGAAATDKAEPPFAEDEQVLVREGDRCWFVPIRSIRELVAEGNYTRIHFDGGKPLLYRTLVSMEARLPAKLFLRANRSQLINLSFIESVDPWFSGSIKVRLRGGGEVEFSRRQAQLFKERLSL